ncbi:MAG: AAA family ATPase [Taibaiella sp.]|nr:AAA family ATPase [Taibaiella sp.]
MSELKHYGEFIHELTKEEVESWWNSIIEVPEEAFTNHWKYKLKKDGKEIPFNWAIYQLANRKGWQLQEIKSNYYNRANFSQMFDFDISEDLKADKPDWDALSQLYKRIKNKPLFQAYVNYGNYILQQCDIDSYKCRMAISKGHEPMVVLGMKAVYCFSISNSGELVAFIVSTKYAKELNHPFKQKVDNFKGVDKMSLLYFKVDKWEQIPKEVFIEHLKYTKLQYESIKNSRRVTWNSDAKTTSNALKVVMFKNLNAETTLQDISLQQAHDSFISTSNVEEWEWYKQLKKYSEAMIKIHSRAEVFGYSSYEELNTHLRELVNNPNEDFLQRYLFESSNGISTIRQQLITHSARVKIRNLVEAKFSLLNEILKSKDKHFVYRKVMELIGENKYSIVYRFLRAIFPYHFTSIDAPGWFKQLNLKLSKDYNFNLHENNQIDRNWEIIGSVVSEDIYKTQIFFWKLVNDTLIQEPSNDDTESSSNQNNNTMDLNQILYGAPGTGKTYATKKIAVEIIDEMKYDENDRDTILERYNTLVKSRQIVFTTFHQSLSYEDFIEGIKPVSLDENVIYEVKDGIFKDLCTLAKNEKKNYRTVSNEIYTPPFEDAWNALIEKVQNSIEKEGQLNLKTKSGGTIYVTSVSNQGNLIFKPVGTKTKDYTVSFNRAKKLFKELPNFREIKNIDKEFREVIGGSNSTAYWSVLNEIFDWNSKNSRMEVLEHPHKINKFVIIIDEINRGNVSSIFGELITLIEEDKRQGIVNEIGETLELILPYSRDKFSVPDNLYIIGTMNTADRSVEALDTALRRRFSFFEVNPNPNIIPKYSNIEGIDLVAILKTINDRIEILADKDHKIGHSYFLGINTIEDLKDTFQNGILPLLAEYFYGDFGKIGLVLGNEFVRASTQKATLAKDFNYGDDISQFTEKKIFELIEPEFWTLESFTSIYE